MIWCVVFSPPLLPPLPSIPPSMSAERRLEKPRPCTPIQITAPTSGFLPRKWESWFLRGPLFVWSRHRRTPRGFLLCHTQRQHLWQGGKNTARQPPVRWKRGQRERSSAEIDRFPHSSSKLRPLGTSTSSHAPITSPPSLYSAGWAAVLGTPIPCSSFCFFVPPQHESFSSFYPGDIPPIDHNQRDLFGFYLRSPGLTLLFHLIA